MAKGWTSGYPWVTDVVLDTRASIAHDECVSVATLLSVAPALQLFPAVWSPSVFLFPSSATMRAPVRRPPPWRDSCTLGSAHSDALRTWAKRSESERRSLGELTAPRCTHAQFSLMVGSFSFGAWYGLFTASYSAAVGSLAICGRRGRRAQPLHPIAVCASSALLGSNRHHLQCAHSRV